MWAFYTCAMCLVALSVAYLLKRFAAPKISVISLLVTALAWLTALSVVALVPIDVYSTLSHQEADAISTLWSISYWSTQVLTWAIIPTLQGYSISGAFTIWGRFISAMKRNFVFYAIVGGLALIGIFVALISGHLQLATIPGLVFTLSNTYGLIVCILLLGYGLIEIPRILWRRSFPERRLRWHYHRVGRAAEKLTDASAELEKVLAIVLATAQQVPRSDAGLRPYVELLMDYADSYSPVKLSALTSGKVSIDQLEEGDLDYATSMDAMAKLRGRMKLAIAHFIGCRSEYISYVKKAQNLEAICKSRQHGVYNPPSGSTARIPMALWWYKCHARPWVQRFLALLTAAASAVLVWSEATIATGTSPDLSPFSLLIHSGIAKGEFVNQILVALPLCYICGCAYFSLFKIGIFGGFYHMVAHATWAYSLLLSGSQMCRFAAPLCFNFLHVIRMNEYLYHGEQMVFIQKMKGMNDVPVLGHNFNTWFPLTITVYCALLYLNLWEKCMSRVFISSRFRFDTERADDEHTSRGMRLVQLEHDAASKGYPLGDGIGLFGVGSAGLVDGSKQASGKHEMSRLSSRGGMGTAGSTRMEASAAPMDSITRPPLFAGPQGAGSSRSLGPSESLGSAMLGSKHGSSDSLHTTTHVVPGEGGGAGSYRGSPAKAGGAAGGGTSHGQGGRGSEIDDMFATLETRRSRGGRQGEQDTQRLVDASAEPSLLGFKWKRGRT